MPKKVKLAILRARHDTSTPYISDQACIQMLMANQSNLAVFDYWSYNTDGYLDFIDSEMFPWVDITITATDTSRNTQISKAYEATKRLNDNQDLVGFDGFIVLTLPGRMQISNPKAGQPNQPALINLDFDGGAGPQVLGKEACALPVMTSDHTFMCHEVGHVLGFEHTYGVLNNGVDWDGKPPWDEGQVYGDPYDIMSSATFGTRNLDPKKSRYTGKPQFAGASPVGWPVEPKINMGPAPARAHVHLWDPAAIPPDSVRHLQTPNGGKHTVRLYSASARRGSPRLIIIHPPNEDAQGRGRCYLEYRSSRNWDVGLDVAGSDLARQAVVAHTLADASNDGVRCWYRGRILVPLELDSDLAVTGTPLTVRVTDTNLDEGYVELEISTTSPRGVDLKILGGDEMITGIDTQEMGTPCGDTIQWGTWIYQSHYFYQPVTYGYGGEGAPDATPPAVTWTVGGQPVPAGSGFLDVSAADGIFTVEYSIDPVTSELSLGSRGGEKYSLPVIATASEPNGANPTSTTAVFDPLGYTTGFRPGDLATLDSCMSKYLRSMRLRPRDLLIPPGPDPYRQQWRDRINQYRMQEIVRLVSPVFPLQAVALGAISAMRYGGMRG